MYLKDETLDKIQVQGIEIYGQDEVKGVDDEDEDDEDITDLKNGHPVQGLCYKDMIVTLSPHLVIFGFVVALNMMVIMMMKCIPLIWWPHQ